MIQTASEGVLKDLISVLDDFERIPETERSEGIQLIYNKFKNTLQQKGLKLMEVGAGSEFDVELHECITQIPAPSDDLKGKVVDVIEKGYYLHEKVIRYAKVVMGN
jgi:molecular chaperone GrpE